MERGDPVPFDPSWLDGLPPLSQSQRGQLKKAYAGALRLQPALACMAPTDPPCSEPPIPSHSIQHHGPLSVLAEKNDVMVLRYSQSIVERTSTYMAREPIKLASTFPGFCTVHDNSLFEPIDQHSLREPTSEQLFLLALRSVFRDLYTARSMARQRQANLETMLDGPARPGVLEMFVASLLRIEMVLPRLTGIAGAFARWHRDGFHEGLCTIVGKHLPVLPFAVGNYIEPRHDAEGQRIDRSAEPPPFIVLNVVPERGIDRRAELPRRAPAGARVVPGPAQDSNGAARLCRSRVADRAAFVRQRDGRSSRVESALGAPAGPHPEICR